MPNSFLEAAAHGCSILASVYPDDFTRRFGAYAAHDDFESCLNQLQENNEWQARGEAGRVHVSERQNSTAAAALHEKIYLLAMRKIVAKVKQKCEFRDLQADWVQAIGEGRKKLCNYWGLVARLRFTT